MNALPPPRSASPRAPVRRGGVYVAVLGASLIVSLIGLCAMHVARIELRRAAARRDQAQARVLAHSAVELALGRMELDPFWRSNYVSGRLEPQANQPPLSFGGGTLSFRFTDPLDGDLANDAEAPVRIEGQGRAGDSVFVYEAEYARQPDGRMALTPGSWRRIAAAP